jgi:hypothetical protein
VIRRRGELSPLIEHIDQTQVGVLPLAVVDNSAVRF